MTRYDRQERINNWNQQKLLESEVVVCGGGPLAHFFVAAAAALGFGHLRIVDNFFVEHAQVGEFLAAGQHDGRFRAELLAAAAERINPDVEAEPEVWRMGNRRHLSIMGQPDLIIDTSNDPTSELLLYRYGQQHGIPVVNGSARRYHSEVKRVPTGQIVRGDLSPDYAGQRGDPFSASVAAALVADEGRSSLLTLPGDHPLRVPGYYHMLAPNYIDANDTLTPTEIDTDHHALVVGAGALGNWVALLLALKGVKRITLMDDDDIEEVNLNRQIMFTLIDDPIGKPKAEVLAEVVRRINPSVQIQGIKARFDGSDAHGADIIYRCTDSLGSSLVINDYALAHKLPVVYMGTEVHSAQCYAFVPGRNYCLDCLLNLRDTLIANPEEVPDGCLVQPNPSVVTTNLLAAGIGSNYYDAIYHLGDAPRPLPGNVLKYNLLAPNRLVYPFGEEMPALAPDRKCVCHDWLAAAGGVTSRSGAIIAAQTLSKTRSKSNEARGSYTQSSALSTEYA